MDKFDKALQQDFVFSAYEDYTKKKTVLKELVDIIQIIRYEWGQTSELIPFADGVKLRYRDWLFEKNKNKAGVRGTDGSPFTPEQLTWLEMIKNYIAKNASFQPEALEVGVFKKNGGAARYLRLFGNEWENIINELNSALVA